jgi:hypothetical protein
VPCAQKRDVGMLRPKVPYLVAQQGLFQIQIKTGFDQRFTLNLASSKEAILLYINIK